MVKVKLDNKKDANSEVEFWSEKLYSTLDFAQKSLEHLVVEGNSAPEDAPWFVRPEKIIAETAYLMVFAHTYCKFKKVSDKLITLAGVLKPLARSEAMLLNIALKPTLAFDYAHAHICLSYLGHKDEIFDHMLQKALDSQAAQGLERTPYRMLELEWLKSIWTGKLNRSELKKWIGNSCLNNPPDIFNENQDSVYALTHAIMYTCFVESKIDDKNKQTLTDQLEVLIARYMDLHDYDIAGELLMAWQLFGLPFSPSVQFSLDCILKIDKKVGFLPAPGLDLAMIEGKEIQHRRTYIYSINYHTVLVMGLLSAVMHKKTEININLNANLEFPKELKNILVKETLESKERHWIDYFKEIDLTQRSQLIPFLFNIAICRAVQDKNFKLLQKLIEASNNTPLIDSLAFLQASELLERLKLVS